MNGYIANLEERLANEFRNINEKLNDIHNDVSYCRNQLAVLHERVNLIEKCVVQNLPPAKPKNGFQGPPPPGHHYPIPMVYYYPPQ